MTTDQEQPERTITDDLRALFGRPRELWLLYLATLFEYLGVFSFLSTLPIWLSSDHGMSDKQAGYWSAAFSLVLSVCVFTVGSIADVVGIRRTLLASFGLTAVTRLFMALAATRVTALISLFAFAFAYATTSPVLQTAIHRVSDRRTRAFAFSLWYVSLNVGGVLAGPLIDRTRSAFLIRTSSPLATPADGSPAPGLVRRVFSLPLLGPREFSANTTILGFGFLFAALAFLVLCFVRPGFEDQERTTDAQAAPKRSPLGVLKEVALDRTFWRFMALLGFLSLVKMMFQHMHFTWPKYAIREQGEGFPIGRVWALNSLLVLGLVPLVTAVTRKRRAFDVILLGAFISATSPFLLCLGSTLPFQILTVVVLTVGESLWSPRLYEYNVSIAPRGRESTYVSLAALPYFVAKFLVGPTSGWLLDAFCPATGPRRAWALWAIIGTATMVGPVGIWWGRRWMRAEETS